MIKKVDHITFAVKNMAEIGKRLVDLYGAEPVMQVENEKGKYRSDAYIVGGDLIIGFLEATSPDSFVADHIEKFGESLQHIGIDVENLDDSMKKFDEHGVKYAAYSEVEGIRREVLVGRRGSFGAVLQVMEWLGEYKNASSAERMRKAWNLEQPVRDRNNRCIMDLNYLFKPRSIAILGASANDNTIGGRPIRFLKQYGYTGPIYPINPKYPEVQGLTCYPDIPSLPEAVDLLIVVVRAHLVPAAVEQAAAKGVRSVMIFSSGFSEAGEEGRAMQARIAKVALEHDMPVCGPNCQGFIDHWDNVAATFTGSLVKGTFNRGPVAFSSQSGAMGYHFYGMAQEMGLGFSYMISSGNEAVVTTSDYLRYTLEDKNTDVAAAYMEGINDAASLRDSARLALEKEKPLLIMKVGRTKSGSRAASSHTGSIAGQDRLADTLFRQEGILRIEGVGQFFDCFKAFSNPKRLKGDRIGIVSISGGAGVVMADDCEAHGMTVVDFDPKTEEFLKEQLPYFGSPQNPVDLTAQVLTESAKFHGCLKCVVDDPNTDALVIFIGLLEHMKDILIPPIVKAASETDKPILVTWMACDDPIRKDFQKYNIPLYEEPERCMYALNMMNKFRIALEKGKYRGLEAPAQAGPEQAADLKKRLAGQTGPQDEMTSKEILAAFDIPTTRDILARTGEEAARAAGELGFPVAMKVVSAQVTHKTDVGGVALDIGSEDEALKAFENIRASVKAKMPTAEIDGVMVSPMIGQGLEILVGLKNDRAFGPMLMVGLGGTFVEIMKDVSTRYLPINRWEAEEMLRELKAYPLLKGARGQEPRDVEALIDVLLKVSRLGTALGDMIDEMDINPLRVFNQGQGLCAIDALVTLK